MHKKNISKYENILQFCIYLCYYHSNLTKMSPFFIRILYQKKKAQNIKVTNTYITLKIHCFMYLKGDNNQSVSMNCKQGYCTTIQKWFRLLQVCLNALCLLKQFTSAKCMRYNMRIITWDLHVIMLNSFSYNVNKTIS